MKKVLLLSLMSVLFMPGFAQAECGCKKDCCKESCACESECKEAGCEDCNPKSCDSAEGCECASCADKK